MRKKEGREEKGRNKEVGRGTQRKDRQAGRDRYRKTDRKKEGGKNEK